MKRLGWALALTLERGSARRRARSRSGWTAGSREVPHALLDRARGLRVIARTAISNERSPAWRCATDETVHVSRNVMRGRISATRRIDGEQGFAVRLRRSILVLIFSMFTLLLLVTDSLASTLRYTFRFELQFPAGHLGGIPVPAEGDPFEVVLDVSDSELSENAFDPPAFKVDHFLVQSDLFSFRGDDPPFGSVSINDGIAGEAGAEAGTAFAVWGRFRAVGMIEGREVRFGVFTASSRILLLEDSTGTALTGGRLPSSLDLEAFDRVQGPSFAIATTDLSSTFTFSGKLVSATVVPEPGTAVLLAVALTATFGLGLFRSIRLSDRRE